MTLHLLDACDDEGYRGSISVGTTARGRNGGKGVATWGNYIFPVAAQSDTVTFGCAMRHSTYAASYIGTLSGPNSQQVQLQITAARRLIISFAGGPTLQSADLLLPPDNTWHYLEMQVKAAASPNGFVTTRINGVVVPALTATGIDTLAFSTPLWDNLYLSANGSISNGVDDVYLCTGAGDSFFGDCVVEALYPNANGFVSAWVGSDLNSTDNYALIDETPFVATDWIGSSTLGAQDLYGLTDLVGAGAVHAICHQVIAQRSDATARNIKMLTRGSTTDASPAQALTNGFAPVFHTLTVNPEGGGAWTAAAINALQVGVEVA